MIIGISGYSNSGKDTVGRLIQWHKCLNAPDVSLENYLYEPNSHDWWVVEQSGWEIKKFAGKLKQIATLLTGIDQKKFEDQKFKQKTLGKEWRIQTKDGYTTMTIRDFLQKLGTDGLREGLHPNVWVNALMADYKPIVDVNTFRYAKGYINDRIASDHEKLFPVGQMFEYLEEVPNPNWIITDVRFENEALAIKQKEGIVIRVNRKDVKPVNQHPSEIALDNWDFDYKISNDSDYKTLSYNVKTLLENAKI